MVDEMNTQDIVLILKRFDELNDSIIQLIMIENGPGPRCDIRISMTVHDSEDDFSSKHITLKLIDVVEMKLMRAENVAAFLLSFGATILFQDDFYFMEMGGNGEPKSLDEMKNEDIFFKFRRCELSEILDIGFA